MNPPKLLALYGLKWNPFQSDVPVDALWRPPELDPFWWRIENLAREGGFALVTGEPGTGKSVALRLVAHHLEALPDLAPAVLTRPQSGVADFYRELGQLFGVPLNPHNRWAGFQALRETWLAHVEATRLRRVLLVDEAQEVLATVLAELRILASADFDSRSLLTVVLCGDQRLTQHFRHQDLLPVASRIRTRLELGYRTPKQLADWLAHVLAQAGQPRLMTDELVTTLTEHAAGNLRVLANLAQELLATAAHRELSQLDHKLYLELFTPPTQARPRSAGDRP